MRNAEGNSVMQLNMGEGKSTVIVQIVAAHLADGERLVRIIAAKAQSKQMAHMLISKLGGLLDRRVFFFPFSRSLEMDPTKLTLVNRHLELCRKSGGVLLLQPEQILSFKLMGLEYLGTSSADATRAATGQQLIKVQQYIDKHSRDIIDESDENFSVKFELIYTIGTQSPVDMSPDRWMLIEHVISLLPKVAEEVQQRDPAGIELGPCESGQFPRLRFLKEAAGREVLHRVAQLICDNGTHRLPISHHPRQVRREVFKFMLLRDLSIEAMQRFESLGIFHEDTKNALFLLRGLFAGGILAFTFGQKRWRVNYGLTDRTPETNLAVPYRAKDSPSQRSEYSQPDVVIVLTCLAYYYGGLTDEQLMVVFKQLERQFDQADTIYGAWAAQASQLDPAFHQLSGINLKHGPCRERVFPALRHNKAVIDFFLEKVVFPKEMLDFPQ